MTVQEISFKQVHQSTTVTQSQKDMADMLCQYLRGEPVYIRITSDPKRAKAVARLNIDHSAMQNLLHGNYDSGYIYRSGTPRHHIVPKPENVDIKKMGRVHWYGDARWDNRTNRMTGLMTSQFVWLKGYEGGTVWSYEKPEVPKVQAKDKLGREINVGDFISYILYAFDGKGAAGIYYGKVSKIEDDGTVWAKNIKLTSEDRQDEKRIKDNGLIVIMTKDLMDKLMLARLSSL